MFHIDAMVMNIKKAFSCLSIIVIATLIGLFSAVISHAEWCRMIGCKGEVGYVFIPMSQQFSRSDRNELRSNNSVYRIQGRRIFKQFGIPEVNSIVTINTNTSLMTESCIAANKQEIAKFSYMFDDTKKIATIREYNIEGCLRVESGAKVKILGYRLLTPGKPGDDRLFALVLYVSDN